MFSTSEEKRPTDRKSDCNSMTMRGKDAAKEALQLHARVEPQVVSTTPSIGKRWSFKSRTAKSIYEYYANHSMTDD